MQQAPKHINDASNIPGFYMFCIGEEEEGGEKLYHIVVNEGKICQIKSTSQFIPYVVVDTETNESKYLNKIWEQTTVNFPILKVPEDNFVFLVITHADCRYYSAGFPPDNVSIYDAEILTALTIEEVVEARKNPPVEPEEDDTPEELAAKLQAPIDLYYATHMFITLGKLTVETITKDGVAILVPKINQYLSNNIFLSISGILSTYPE